MKRAWLIASVAALAGVGCTTQQDSGVVMGCFGVVNQSAPAQGVVNPVVTNLYFGGCSPADFSGMQILERATQQAADDLTPVTTQCDQDCNSRIAAYAAAHPGQMVPGSTLSCQTLFAAPCPGIGADVGSLSADTSAFQGGGPADERFSLTGTVTVTINQSPPVAVPAVGLVDATLGTCSNGTQGCVTISRLDVTSAATAPFTVNGITFDSAEVQNQGIGTGSTITNPASMAINPLEIEVSALEDSTQTTLEFHTQTQTLTELGSNMTLNKFFQVFSLTTPTTTQQTPLGPVTFQVAISMQGTPIGSPPIASMTPSTDGTKYECTCAECTSVSFVSTATDPDNDLQSLAWVLDNTLQGADGTSAPPELDLQLALSPSPASNTHTVKLVATDSRGATSASSHTFSIVDSTPPKLTPPPAVTLRSCDFPYIGQATATDICSGQAAITNNSPGQFPAGTTVVTWTAEDASGNVAIASQSVTVTQVAQTVCCPAGSNIIDGTKIAQGPNGVRTINGTSGPDCIIGSPNNDVINGMGGDDVIFGNGGQDQIIGGPGNDTIIVGNGTNTTVEGDDGDDRIVGGATQDHITGGVGNDIIIGGGGDDVIDGGDGNDIIYGNAGNDTITGGNGSDLIDGGDGVDHITCGDGNDTVSGGVGPSSNNDVITCDNGSNFIAGFTTGDHLTGGTGNDTIFGGGSQSVCASGGGTDVIFCKP